MLEVRGRKSRTSEDAVRPGAPREGTVAPFTDRPAVALSPHAITTAYGFTKSDDADTGTSETIAVVDAYDDHTITADLATFSSNFGLPSCTEASGCFTQDVTTKNGSAQAVTESWAIETNLDVEWIHAMAPKAHILLVEAYSTTLSTMLAAVTQAAGVAPYVSMSWGGFETRQETAVDVFADHPTVSFFASSGDTASEILYPAASPAVISVGGTKLTVTQSTGSVRAESAWKTGGGGCSRYETANAAQARFPTYDQGSATCGGKRAIPDVAADATPATGVAVYVALSTGSKGWWQVGGTSLSAPLWAGHAAAAGLHVNATLVYGHTIPFHDVTTGSNGHTCVKGYNLCDGLGSWSSSGTVYDAPLAPPAPSATAGVGDAVVSWSAPTPGDAAITAYSVTSQPGGAHCTWTAGPLSCTVAGLTNGTSYTFSVTATNALGTSASSPSSAAVTPDALLTAPTGEVAVAHTTKVHLSWTAAATAGGYDVYEGTTSGGETYGSPAAGCADVGATSCTATGLRSGTTYYFTVKSLRAGVAWSSPSQQVSAATVPAPADLAASTLTGSVSLTWAAVSGATSVAYDAYEATSAGAETYLAPVSACTSVTTTSCTMVGLPGSPPYYFTVTAAGTEPDGVAFTTTASNEAAVGVPQDDAGGGTNSSGGGGGGGSGGGGGGSSTAQPSAPAPPAGTSSHHTCAVASGTCHVANDGITLTTSTGAGALTVAQYTVDPVGTPTFSSTNEYFDIDAASGSSFGSVTATDCNLDGGSALYWWNAAASKWETVSPVSPARSCLTVTFSSASSPTIDQLTGTVFAVGTASEKATRISGATADATAANELAQQFTPAAGDCPPSASVVLTRDDYYSDALASQYLAASLTTGTLLTPTDSLSAATRTAIEDEGIAHVYIVGGSFAVSTAVERAIEALPADACGGMAGGGGTVQVTRLSGATEYATAQMVATSVRSSFVGRVNLAGAYAGTNAAAGGGKFNDTAGNASGRAPTGAPATAIVATGAGFQDAESASVIAYDEHFPILLTAPASLSAPAATAISALGITQVIVMGGPDAVGDAVVTDLEALGVSVVRVAGTNATDTAVEAAQFELSGSGLHWTPTAGVVVARGDFYSDGLAGAVVAAGAGRSSSHGPEPLLLTDDPATVGGSLASFLKAAGTASGIATDDQPVTSLTVLGGVFALTTTTLDTIESDLRA